MKKDQDKNEPPIERKVAPDEKTRLYSIAGSILLSDQARQKLSDDEELVDADGKTVRVREFSVDTGDIEEPTTLRAIGVEHLEMGYVPHCFDRGAEYPETITMLVRQFGLDEEDDGKWYIMHLKDDSSEIEIMTKADTYTNVLLDNVTGAPVDLSEYDEDTVDAMIPDNRPVTQQEALDVRSILMAAKEIVS
jgi:hypothetical protein